jgi:CRP-like cAMP-binding protein
MLLAEASMFASHYHCDAVANYDSRLSYYNREIVLEKLRSHPEFSESLAVYMSGEILTLRTKLELANIQSADERLLTWVRLHADPHTHTMTISESLKNIAEELGIAHETLYRSLKRLEGQNILRRDMKKNFLTL